MIGKTIGISHPTAFIEQCVVLFNSDDPTAESTAEQIEMLEPFRAELEGALKRFRTMGLSYGQLRAVDQWSGNNVIKDVQRAIPQIQPDSLRKRFENLIDEVAKQFNNEWEECRKQDWRHQK